jgi:hypothetical protein
MYSLAVCLGVLNLRGGGRPDVAVRVHDVDAVGHVNLPTVERPQQVRWKERFALVGDRQCWEKHHASL